MSKRDSEAREATAARADDETSDAGSPAEAPGEATAPAASAETGPAAGGDDANEDARGSREVAELREELDALNDRHLRLAAEFDNYRKRSQAELGSSGIRAQASLVERLLDILDDFRRVTSTDPGEASVESLLEGVRLVEQKLHRALGEAGLEPIEPEGEPFDPNVMEAMIRVPAESREEDETVDQVLQTGFRFRGHLVRPARVSVRKYE